METLSGVTGRRESIRTLVSGKFTSLSARKKWNAWAGSIVLKGQSVRNVRNVPSALIGLIAKRGASPGSLSR